VVTHRSVNSLGEEVIDEISPLSRSSDSARPWVGWKALFLLPALGTRSNCHHSQAALQGSNGRKGICGKRQVRRLSRN